MTADIRQAPGWWPSLVQVVCDDCNYRGRVVDVNDDRARRTVRWERDDHVCGQDPSGDEA